MEQFAKTITNVIKNSTVIDSFQSCQLHFTTRETVCRENQRISAEYDMHYHRYLCHITYHVSNYIRRSRIARTKRLTPKDSSRRVLRESELKLKYFSRQLLFSQNIAFAGFFRRTQHPANARSGEVFRCPFWITELIVNGV